MKAVLGLVCHHGISPFIHVILSVHTFLQRHMVGFRVQGSGLAHQKPYCSGDTSNLLGDAQQW